MKKLVQAVIAVSTMLLASCGTMSPTSTSPTSSSLKTTSKTVTKGMTQTQVTQIMGTPHTKIAMNGRETWVYTNSNKGEMFARGFAGNFIPVVGPLVSFAGAETKNSTTTVTFSGSRVSKVDTMSSSAPIMKNVFSGF